MKYVFIELTRLVYDATGSRQPGEKLTINLRYLMSFKPDTVRVHGHTHEGTTVEYRGNQGYGNHTVLVEEPYQAIWKLLSDTCTSH